MAHLKNIISIINPASGVDTPILAQLNRATQAFQVSNHIFVTQKDGDAQRFARKALRLKPDAILVYGGDGTVVDVAGVLYRSATPLIIIPGGSANVIAKELGIPTNTEEALKILGRKVRPTTLNVSKMGKELMFLRVEVGVIAEMVNKTSRELKDSLGVLAYPIAALKELAKTPSVRYSITVDGTKHELEGIGLTVANVGNIGLPGISLQAKIRYDDDFIDVLVLQSSDLPTLISMGSSVLMGTEKPVALHHWQGKSITVRLASQQTVISDDKPLKTTRFTVRLLKEHLTVLQ